MSPPSNVFITHNSTPFAGIDDDAMSQSVDSVAEHGALGNVDDIGLIVNGSGESEKQVAYRQDVEKRLEETNQFRDYKAIKSTAKDYFKEEIFLKMQFIRPDELEENDPLIINILVKLGIQLGGKEHAEYWGIGHAKKNKPLKNLLKSSFRQRRQAVKFGARGTKLLQQYAFFPMLYLTCFSLATRYIYSKIPGGARHQVDDRLRSDQ